MRRKMLLLTASSILAMAMAMRGLALAAPQEAPPIVPSGEGLPDGAGKDVVVKTCGVCHEARRAASVRLTREGWETVIAEMVRRGAKGSEADLAQVLDYLAVNFLGEAMRPVNINSAPQIDLETVIGLRRTEAAALVAWRNKDGPCKSLDELKKVKGLDFKKIDAARDRAVCF
ncbi:MAG: helix-hairpin-helix domain-containing protein [Vicinamibacterales bacterium]